MDGADLGGGPEESGYYANQFEVDQKVAAAQEQGRKDAWGEYRQTISTGNPNGLYVDPNAVNDDKYTGASNVLASLHRNQWSDWRKRFQPRLEQLADYAQSGELTDKGVQLAGQAVDQAFINREQSYLQQNQGLGISLSEPQRKAANRSLGLSMAAEKTAARNQARISGNDRDMQILAGGGGLQMGVDK